MKSYTNVGDPEKKKKKKQSAPDMEQAGTGPVTQEVLAERRQAAKAVPDEIQGKEARDYSGTAAPRVGGPAPKKAMNVTGAPTVKLMRQSKKNVKKSSASPQAKKSAIRNLKARY